MKYIDIELDGKQVRIPEFAYEESIQQINKICDRYAAEREEEEEVQQPTQEEEKHQDKPTHQQETPCRP